MDSIHCSFAELGYIFFINMFLTRAWRLNRVIFFAQSGFAIAGFC